MTQTRDGLTAQAQAPETDRDDVGHAGELRGETCSPVAKQSRETFGRAGDVIRRNPVRSAAFIFGAGLTAGVFVGLAVALWSRSGWGMLAHQSQG